MGAYTEIVDFTFTANETSRTFSGLSITKDDFVKIVATRTRKSGDSFFVSIFPNGETTATHYHTQQFDGAGSTAGAVRTNNNNTLPTLFSNTSEGNKSSHFVYMKLSENNRVNFFANANQQIGSSVGITLTYITSSGVTFPTGITSLNLSGNITTGDRIQIYKLDAEKVADITVASNTTQVDISNLSIDKDSEYLLVSDSVAGQTDTSIHLCVNDDTDFTNYHTQLIVGNGSSAAAIRLNTTRFGGGATAENSLSYVHIKLSNIGAYTAQAYTIRGAGSSALQLQNWFTSSTAENITSITKLNIVASGVTQTINAGARFTLYKLYE